MALLVLRFDLRNPAFAGVSGSARYRAALDMCAWADERPETVAVVLSEHHGSDDGYLPSALTMAGAVAAVTERVPIWVSAVAAPLHDPLHLAEQALVVDHLSDGRLTLVLANGYVPDEFALFDVPMAERVRRTTEAVEVLKAARVGEPFEYRGRTVHLTPAPDGRGPTIWLGGSSPGAARRAARIADGFQPSNTEAWEVYRSERLARGRRDPGDMPGLTTGFLHVSRDPDRAWQQISPFARHDAESYGRWAAAGGMGDATGYQPPTDAELDDMRATGRYRVATPEEIRREMSDDPFHLLVLSPMMGGIPPELAWESLHLLADEVLG